MSGTAVKVIQLFASLSILIVLHEFGHFFFARLFKTRVEKFYLFFDFLFPLSGVLNFSLFKKKKGDTEFGIGWFPLGGYVKISGMVDESMDKEQMAKPPQPWEYRSKKAYQRLLIMLGGIIVNVLVAIILYITVFAVWGEEYLPMQNVKYGVAVDSTGQSIGLRNGDIIRSVDGKPVDRFERLPAAIFYSKDEKGQIQIVRDGKDTTINIPIGTINKMSKLKKGGFISPRTPAVIDSVLPSSIAAKSNFRKGDSIISVNGESALYTDEVRKIEHANYDKPISIVFVRNQAMDSVTVTVPKDSLLGILDGVMDRHLEFTTVHYGIGGAMSRGTEYTGEKFIDYITQFKMIFTSKEIKAKESVGGFISFGKIFPDQFDLREFILLTAFISIILAFMNLLPIPGLDGGYVIFLLFEMISGKKVSEKVMERATTVGLVLLLALMVYANGLDIFRLFKK
jgi:regulator of sigma E protease